MLKELIRRILWKILGEAPKKVAHCDRVDTMKLRRDMIELSLLNVSICTRGESIVESSVNSPDKESLSGDYAEFGVFQGATFSHCFHVGNKLMPRMRYYAFDSFEGLPEIEGIDEGGEFFEGQFQCSRQDFIKNISARGVDLEKVVVCEGWFDQSLTKELCEEKGLEVVSVAFIDCDLYLSCIPVLKFLTPLLRQGSILLFDDWYNFKGSADRGVQRATNEWLSSNPTISLRSWMPFCHHGQAFIVEVESCEVR